MTVDHNDNDAPSDVTGNDPRSSCDVTAPTDIAENLETPAVAASDVIVNTEPELTGAVLLEETLTLPDIPLTSPAPAVVQSASRPSAAAPAVLSDQPAGAGLDDVDYGGRVHVDDAAAASSSTGRTVQAAGETRGHRDKQTIPDSKSSDTKKRKSRFSLRRILTCVGGRSGANTPTGAPDAPADPVSKASQPSPPLTETKVVHQIEGTYMFTGKPWNKTI